VLALTGVAVAGYLVIENVQGNTGVCVGVHGCAEVQNSPYGKILGVHVSIPGLLAYLALLALAAGWYRDAGGFRPHLALAGFLVALGGVLMSAHLTFVEAFVLDAWCSYCIVSALLMTGLILAWSSILWLTMRE
jgi:uncharacterized membrane protein